MKTTIDQTNIHYIEDLFAKYQASPQSVSPEWKLFFDGVDFARVLDQGSFSKKELQIYELIQFYRENGYFKARLDPLGLAKPQGESFNLSRFGLEKEDEGQKFEVFSALNKDFQNLGKLIQYLEKTYCSTLALNVQGCPPQIRQWFYQAFEQSSFQMSVELKQKVLKKLTQVEAFEKFLHNRFLGAKRFSIEGSDILIPMLEQLVDQGAQIGVQEFILGMSHRGRLNVMTNFTKQHEKIILSQFEGGIFSDIGFTGDVKYHIGYSCIKKTFSNHSCQVLLGFNPSHLESIVPVICGVTRARQRMLKDTQTRKKALSILIHGDASFCGQGVVSESLQLSQLKGYTVGGAIHIIVNNQIGFTTNSKDGRSTPFSSDLSKSVRAPVLLVNGDDVASCIQAINIAVKFRQEFQQDIVIELISYRRFGHNEGDEPSFTQPLMYSKIKQHPTLMNIYKKQLIQEKVITDDQGKGFQEHTDYLQGILDQIRKKPEPIQESDLRGPLWIYNPKPSDDQIEENVKTTPSSHDLNQVFQTLTSVPENINLHPKVKRLIENRKKSVDSSNIDWGLAELAAYGTLCLEGHPVRVSGQDCKRGTFSHRHASYFDVQNAKEYTPLAMLSPKQSEFRIYNSPLSEFAVLGFEYGNSCSDHKSLNIWEAQFGDFANGAQIIIDQYISSGEEKWMQSCSLTLFLPHGYEGQGSEHSSARMERFLQLCAQNNMQVCYPTSPANLFHLLRRQVKRDFYKPLVVMTPKSLLRHPQMVSHTNELLKGSFKEVLVSKSKSSTPIKSLILCTGKIYFDLMSKKNHILDHTMVIRLEQIYPFPRKSLGPYLNGLSSLEKIIWLQEEPKNMGAYSFVRPELQEFLKDLGKKNVKLEYIGRESKASPADGSFQGFEQEQKKLVNRCLAQMIL